jgi:hypothetical protein
MTSWLTAVSTNRDDIATGLMIFCFVAWIVYGLVLLLLDYRYAYLERKGLKDRPNLFSFGPAGRMEYYGFLFGRSHRNADDRVVSRLVYMMRIFWLLTAAPFVIAVAVLMTGDH